MVNSLPALTMPKWGLWTGMIQVDPSNDPKWIQVVGAPLGCFGWIPRRQWNPTASGFPSGLPWSARPAGLLQLCGSQTRLPFEILVFTAPPPRGDGDVIDLMWVGLADGEGVVMQHHQALLVMLDVCWSRVHQDTALGWYGMYGDRSQVKVEGTNFLTFFFSTQKNVENHPISTSF